MARNTWNIEKYTGGVWGSDGTVYRPNENFEINLTSTQVKGNLANGGRAFMTPETLYNPEPLVFTWLRLDYNDALLSKVTNYIKNHDYLRITDHLGNTYTGSFIGIQQVWLTGEADTFDYKATFEVMA